MSSLANFAQLYISDNVASVKLGKIQRRLSIGED